MTYTEPNALPQAYESWQEWRESHAEFVTEFEASNRGASDVLLLKIRLQRLGYFGARLEDEIRHIKECTAS